MYTTYVLDINGNPLMPTHRPKHVKHLLKTQQAKVVRRTPFTIQLLYVPDTQITQPVTLGVDAGSKSIGLSATTATHELYAGEIELRSEIVKLIATRSELRKNRRRRKTRYRPTRYLNRTSTMKKGWLAPSIRQKIETHFTAVAQVLKLLPITCIIIETASFNIQKLQKPDICGEEYQTGVQTDFANVREYVLWRDKHKCQCCKGKSGDKKLDVHHIESRKTGGDSPDNLITLCHPCHEKYHLGIIQLPKSIKRMPSYRDAAFMGIMRWNFFWGLKNRYPNLIIKNTYGYITKQVRVGNLLPKAHYIDARCISRHPSVIPLGYYFYQKKVRCHNRQIYRAKIAKGNIRKRRQAEYELFGFRLYDIVRYRHKSFFIAGRRQCGRFDLRHLDFKAIPGYSNVDYRNLTLFSKSKSYLIEQRSTVELLKENGLEL